MSYLNPRAIAIDTPMPPPAWALMEWELIRAQTRGCTEFFAKYFDERGYLECLPRWGGNDGPDDAIENLVHWPVLYVLGGGAHLYDMCQLAWEGHLKQYTEAKTTEVPFTRDGMYYREFPVMFDWVHNGEGLTTFNLHGLMNPRERAFEQRVRRYAGFYMGDDPQAPNYDPEHKIIKSLFNGSRGPMLRKATALDWAGDPLDEVQERFIPLHGERNFEEMLAHFKDYTDVVGDHPQNMVATALGLNAYALTGEDQYKDWVLEYVEAWRQRTLANDGIIPTNIGLDGTIGGECDGKWYGGCYGWAFTVEVPQTGAMSSRNTHGLGISGFGNALLLSGEQQFVDVWRQMIDTINANGKEIDGQMMYPHMHGDEGWYEFQPGRYAQGAQEVYYWSMDRADLGRLNAESGWFGFLEGRDPAYPEAALQADFARLRDANGEGAPRPNDAGHSAVGQSQPIQSGHSRRPGPAHVGRADAAPRLAAALPSALLRSAGRAGGDARGRGCAGGAARRGLHDADAGKHRPSGRARSNRPGRSLCRAPVYECARGRAGNRDRRFVLCRRASTGNWGDVGDRDAALC